MGNPTKVLVGLRKLSQTLLAALGTALASCPAVILRSGVHCLVIRLLFRHAS